VQADEGGKMREAVLALVVGGWLAILLDPIEVSLEDVSDRSRRLLDGLAGRHQLVVLLPSKRFVAAQSDLFLAELNAPRVGLFAEIWLRLSHFPFLSLTGSLTE
jgi:hypothetical protein